MGNVQLATLSLKSGETKTYEFPSSVFNAEVALKGFSGNRVSCELVGISGNKIMVKASSDTGSPVHVLIIAVIEQ